VIDRGQLRPAELLWCTAPGGGVGPCRGRDWQDDRKRRDPAASSEDKLAVLVGTEAGRRSSGALRTRTVTRRVAHHRWPWRRCGVHPVAGEVFENSQRCIDWAAAHLVGRFNRPAMGRARNQTSLADQ